MPGRAPAALVALLLCCCLWAQPRGAGAQAATLIVQYRETALATAAAAAVDPAAVAAAASAVADAAAVAVAAAEDRGASTEKKAAIAAMASDAASTMSALAAITSAVSVAAASSGIRVVGETPYATVFRGAAIRTASAEDAARLKEQLEANPAVSNVWFAGARQLVKPVELPAGAVQAAAANASAAMPATELITGSAPAFATSGNAAATGLSRLASMASGSGLDGSGVLVCIVDTGVNYRTATFGSCTGLNAPRGQCRVATGFNFVGNAYNGELAGPPPQRGGEPTDCMGHGTMVASVAATTNGVAPGALLGSYRVFGCSGFATDDIIIEAIDRAVRDGCDVINLSLASGSGYADTSVYGPVMRNALDRGVIVVKAAGNSGEDGPFTADVFTAAGSIATASVGDDVFGTPLDESLVASGFSSYGPDPSLELTPLVAAPGAFISARDMSGGTYRASGTSFASPYVAGVLALWLQHRQRSGGGSASSRGLSSGRRETTQEAAVRGLVATSRGVPSRGNQTFLEPLAKAGAGLIQADALLANQAHVSPTLISLPSALRDGERHNATVVLAWDGPPRHGAGEVVVYDVRHEPAAAVTVGDGWYGTRDSLRVEYVAADVVPEMEALEVNTTSRRPAKMQVTFSLPPALSSKGLLYSGILRLVPRDTSLPPVAVPYQGYSRDWTAVRVLARPEPSLSSTLATELQEKANALCYAPGSRPKITGAIQDAMQPVPQVCSGGFARTPEDVLDVSLAQLRSSPECSLRVTLVPEVPMHWLYISVLDAETNRTLGRLKPLDTSSGSSLGTAREVWSYCLHFDGSYLMETGNGRGSLHAGRTYRLQAKVQGPLAAADAALGRRPRRSEVDIRGAFRVTV